MPPNFYFTAIRLWSKRLLSVSMFGSTPFSTWRWWR